MSYTTPVEDITRAMALTGYGDVAANPQFVDADPASVRALLEEFGRFAAAELLPLDAVGDRVGSRLVDGKVVTPPGFRAFYRRYVDAGWGAVPFDPAFGGGGMPWSVAVAMQEILAAANVAFSLCPMLTQGAVELLSRWGTPSQQARYLPRLITGACTGTMNLTEPDAGSDVGAVRTTAVPKDDGTWAITGTKIFITWGDHDLVEDVLHLVLARAPGAPPGTKGISVFAVPSRLEGGATNRLRCLSLEHKMGIHASPTAVLSFEGATGELVGELHGGMPVMFTMMNRARLSVGLEGLGLSERAFQVALDYANVRHQGRRQGSVRPVPIAEHPDVRRMLLAMRADIDAMRVLIYATANAIDVAESHPDPEARQRSETMAGLLVPLAKAWPTDAVNEVTSTAIQVHGGAGYIEETGVAQLARDARISSIYEGTNGIQAIDLVLRKLSMAPGDALPVLLDELGSAAGRCRELGDDDLATCLRAIHDGLDGAARWVVANRDEHQDTVLAMATPFLDAVARTVAGTLLTRRLVGGDEVIADDRDRAVARYFLTHRLPLAADFARMTEAGTSPVLAISTAGLASR